MKKLMLAVLATGVVFAASVPVSVQRAEAYLGIGGATGVVWHAQVVNRCKNRQLTKDEAHRTYWFPVFSVMRAYRDCNDKKKK